MVPDIDAVMKRLDSNCRWDLSDHGEAATASNLSEYTISHIIRSKIAFRSCDTASSSSE